MDKKKYSSIIIIAKIALPTILALIAGVLGSAIVTEMTDEKGNIQWMTFYQTFSFKLIVVYIIIYAIYDYFIYKKETSLVNIRNLSDCQEYIYKQCLPDLVNQYKEDIKNDKGIVGVHELMEQLKVIDNGSKGN